MVPHKIARLCLTHTQAHEQPFPFAMRCTAVAFSDVAVISREFHPHTADRDFIVTFAKLRTRKILRIIGPDDFYSIYMWRCQQDFDDDLMKNSTICRSES